MRLHGNDESSGILLESGVKDEMNFDFRMGVKTSGKG
jgi:hypothetical protein